jgi:hypothetical protein
MIAIARKKLSGTFDRYPYLRNQNDLVVLIPTADPVAFTDFKTRKIYIPFLMCWETWLITEAISAEVQDDRLIGGADEYIKFLKVRNRLFARTRGDINRVVMMSFYDFANLDRPDFSSNAQKRYIQVQEQMLVSSFCFLIAHELAHLVLNHKPSAAVSSSRSIAQEYEADKFAANSLRRAGIELTPAFLIIQRYVDDVQFFSENSSSHPSAECRIERLIRQGAMVELFHVMPGVKGGVAPTFSEQQKEELFKAIRTLREHCLND